MYRNRRPYAIGIATLVLTLTCLAVLIWPDAPLTGGGAAAQTPAPTPTPSGWTHCAAENGFCAFQGTKTVRFGAGGTYYTQTFTAGVSGGVQCSNAVFGDPTPGTVKSCDYQNDTTPAPSPTPWQTDPMGNPGNYTLFRDDNLFIAGEVAYSSEGQKCEGYTTPGYFNKSYQATASSDATLNGFTETGNLGQPATGNLSNFRIAGGSGRILKPDAEQGVLFKLSDFQGGDTGSATYTVELFDKSGNLFVHSFPAVQASRYSHLDVAVGDLDRLPNANGEYQDEVVLVSETNESGKPTMQLTVISFLTPADASWTNCADENGTCTFDGTRVVRYGADGNYRYGTFNGSVNCSNDVFGDPIPFTGKSCDQAPLTPLITTIDTKISVGYFPDDPVKSPNNFNRGGQVSVAVGDFDADGKMEIAATAISAKQIPISSGVNLSLYRYTNDGKGDAQIASNDSQPVILDAYAYADVAAGDFTGAGHDQVIIGWVGPNAPEHNVSINAYDVTTDATSGNLKSVPLSGPNTLGSSRNGISGDCNGNVNCNPSINQPGWVQLKAGLFKYDPFNGYTTRRRQLGVVWGNSRPAFGIAEIPPGAKTIGWLPGAGFNNVDSVSGANFCVSCPTPSVAAYVPDTREAYTMLAGNFGGFNPQNPAWQLAVVTPSRTDNYTESCGFVTEIGIAAYQYTHGNGTTDSPYTFSLQNLPAPASANNLKWTQPNQGGRGVAAVALDLDGNSLRLGAPVKITVDNLFTTDAVLQEPPKHLDWVCSNFSQPGAQCDFVNVSRYKEFNLTYKDVSGTETSNEVNSTSDTSIGKSSAKTAEESVSAGIPDIASVDTDAEQKWESESDFKTSQENYNKNVQGESFTFETSTAQADQIYARTRTMVVYRYPLYGKPDPNNPGQQKFYDLTLPVETDVVSSPGDTSEWYQPIHENGNLLTYPYTPFFDPSSDYGFFAVGQEGQCSVSKSLSCRQNSDCPASESCTGALPGLLGQPVVNTFGSNPTKVSIEYTNAGTTGAKFLTSQTLKSSEEFKYGFKAHWSLPIEVVDVGAGGGGSLQYNTSDESSWSQSSVSESTTSSAQGIDFNVPSISAPLNAFYQYKTWAYIAEGGFLKVAHSANVVGPSVSSWYAQTYGQTYDLSLNLPNKFLPDETNSSEEGKFTLNTDISRKETKSLFITDPSLPTVGGAPAYIAGGIDPTDPSPDVPGGKTLQLNARVYNLSTAKPITPQDNLVARFELVTYNQNNATEGTTRQKIAEVQVPAIDYYASSGCTTSNPNYPMCNSAVVTATWDTTGLTPGQYRLYVVLDPNNAMPNEYHEWQDRRADPLLQVAGDPDGGQPVDDNRQDANGNPFHLEKGQNNEGWTYINVVAPSTDTLSNRTPELSMAKNSLAADVFAAAPSAGRAPANIHTPVRVRATVTSDGDNLGNQHVLLYDEDPDQGGKPFAARLLRGVTKGANHLWVTYTPRRLGRQTIWARVVEHAADTKPGNHTDSLMLIVRPADKQPPRLSITVTPLVLFPPDDRMVEVAATVLAADNQDREPRVRLEAITYNDGNDASADVSGAAFGTDDRQFALRAKRATRGEGPVIYEVVYSATDRAGNKTYARGYVTVPRRR